MRFISPGLSSPFDGDLTLAGLRIVPLPGGGHMLEATGSGSGVSAEDFGRLGADQEWTETNTFSDVAIFSAPSLPFVVTGTDRVDNLNVEFLDGHAASYFRALANVDFSGLGDATFDSIGATTPLGYLNASAADLGSLEIAGTFLPSSIGINFANLGAGAPLVGIPGGAPVNTNLDADLLDGQHGSYYRNADNLNAGTVGLAQGGTDADNSSQAINLVFASPGSGGAGAAAWRALVAADIPALDAAKITSGAFAKAQQHAQTAYLDAAAGQAFANAQKIVTLLNLGSQTAATGLVIGDQSAVLDAGSLTSNIGLTIYADGNAGVNALNYVNRSTGSSAAIGLQYILATSTGVLKRAGNLGVYKNGAWTNGTVNTQNSDFILYLSNDGTLTQLGKITSKGFLTLLGNDVAIGPSGANATSATSGFLYVPTCAGTPTGVPTGFTGKVPLVYDTTNNKLYAYNGGAWKTTTAFA